MIKKAKLSNKINVEECTICEPEQIASIFIKFFSNIGKNLANNISVENQPCLFQYLPSPVSSSMFLVNPDLIRYIKSLLRCLIIDLLVMMVSLRILKNGS